MVQLENQPTCNGGYYWYSLSSSPLIQGSPTGVAKLLGALHPKGTTELLPLYETPPTSPVHNASGWLVFLGREGGLTRPGSVLKGMSKNT